MDQQQDPVGNSRPARGTPSPIRLTDRILAALGLLLVAMIAIAWLGWHPIALLTLAAFGGVGVVLMALLNLRSQARAGQVTREALQDVEARMAGIIESAMDAIVTIDESQRIVQFNAAAEAMFHCPRDMALGTSIDWFIPHRYRGNHAAHVARFGESGGVSRRMGAERIIMGVRRTGEEFPIDASISQTSEHGTRYYTVILRDVTERFKVENELRRSKAELSEYASAAHTVREQEKSRIARELHDELGQALTALKMDVGWLRGHMPSELGLVREKLDRMELLLNNTVTATRRISTELRPLILDDLGVIAATEWLVDNFRGRTGLECTFEVSDHELSWQDPLATAIFRIVQESLTNIARHAKASSARIEITQNEVAVLLIITDDGVGFVPDESRKPNSFGLLGLRERAHLLGGDALIDSKPGKGTRIEVSLPLSSQGAVAS